MTAKATELRTALKAAQTELEEWRFTNRIDELQRALEAAQQRIESLETAANSCINEALAMGAQQLAQRGGSGEAVHFYRIVGVDGAQWHETSAENIEGIKATKQPYQYEFRTLYTTPPAAVQPFLPMLNALIADPSEFNKQVVLRAMSNLARLAVTKQPDSGRDAALYETMLSLLVESQSSIGGDWRERRDDAVASATRQGKQAPAAKYPPPDPPDNMSAYADSQH